MVKEINQDEFANVVKGKKVFVDCYAPWCGPCKMLAPIVDMVSEEITNYEFYKINVDEAPKVASQFGIMSIPTLLIFENGTKVNQITGFMSKEELEDILK